MGFVKDALFGRKGPQAGLGSPGASQVLGNINLNKNLLSGTANARELASEQAKLGVPQTIQGDIAARQQAIQSLQGGLGGYGAGEEAAMFSQAADRAMAGANSAAQTAQRQALARGQMNDPLQQLRAQQGQQRGFQQSAQDLAVMNAQEAQRRKEALAQMTQGAAQQGQDYVSNIANLELARRNAGTQQMLAAQQAQKGQQRSGGLMGAIGNAAGNFAGAAGTAAGGSLFKK